MEESKVIPIRMINVTFFAEQLEESPTDVYHYKVIFKPSAIIPDIDVQTP